MYSRREICKQMACKVARRSLCDIALDLYYTIFSLVSQYLLKCFHLKIAVRKHF